MACARPFGARSIRVLFRHRALKRHQKNSDVFMKKIDGVASVFAKFVFDDFSFAVPKEVFMLGIVKRTSDQLDLIIHVCPTAPFW